MMCDSGQVSPMHYHVNKMEDIICRGGNDIVFTFYNADQSRVHRQEDGRDVFEKDLENDVLIYRDGRRLHWFRISIMSLSFLPEVRH